MNTRTILILSIAALMLAACQPRAVATPIPTIAPTPGAPTAPPPMPTATYEPTVVSPISPLPMPKIVAQNAGSPLATLTLVKLQPGRKYRLTITSPTGAVAFSGTWSQSAVGADGLPGVKSGTLAGATPFNLDIVPPVALVARDWVYSASVSSKGGGIAIAIVDVTP